MNRCHTQTFDLRPAFARALALVAFAPEDDDDGDPSLDDDPVSDGAGGASGEGSDDAAGDDDEDGTDKITNPDKKRLSDEAAKRRRLYREEKTKREAAEARVAELETAAAGTTDLVNENNTLRLRLAFNDACHDGDVSDRDAVWKLAGDDLRSLVDDGGRVDDGRLSAVIASVLERYPAFTKEWSGTHDAPPKDAFPLVPSGRPTTGRQQVQGTVVDFATLAAKFPALRNH